MIIIITINIIGFFDLPSSSSFRDEEVRGSGSCGLSGAGVNADSFESVDVFLLLVVGVSSVSSGVAFSFSGSGLITGVITVSFASWVVCGVGSGLGINGSSAACL